MRAEKYLFAAEAVGTSAIAAADISLFSAHLKKTLFEQNFISKK